MTRDDRLQRLATIAGALRDAALQDVARTAQGCATLRARLAALDAPRPADPVVNPAALEESVLRHALWADERRRLLNEQLALQMAAHLVAQTKARAAMARAMAIDRLHRTRG
jgi:hypothetical protein